MNDYVTRPGELAGVPLRELLDAWHQHLSPLVSARHGLGEPEPAGRLRGAALAALACGQALADRLLALRWPSVVDALTHGATVAEVATATALEPEEVSAGLVSWAHGQLRLNADTGGELGISPAQHAEVLALLGEVAR